MISGRTTIPLLQHVDSPAVIVTRGVTVRFDHAVVALRDISLTVARGEHVVILGASGSGKTTLLEVLSRRLQPTGGSSLTHGRIATIHQDLRLVRRRTALTNVLHGSLGRCGPLAAIRFPHAEQRRAIDLLERVGLAHRVHAPVHQLSGGEQQRVAIARALMSEPDILLADEPIASLDQANARSVLRLLSELQRERGLTMVSVLHDCALAETFGDRLLTIVDGRIVHHAPARGVVHDDCHACDHICAPTSLEPQISHPIGDRSAWRGTAATIGVLGVAGWCMHALGLTDVHTAGLLGQVARFVGRMVPDAGELVSMPWGSLMASMLATAQMSLLGTLMAAIIALPLSALAAKNVAPGLIATPVRVMLNVWRSVPSILWALLLVAAVGLGASAGVMALAAYSVGYLTKFFYEAFEQAERGAAGVLRDLGAGPLQRFVHAVWPASLPAVAAAGLFMVEYNLRAAGVLGIVGAGGIGQDLKMAVDWGNWHVVGVILAMFALTVIIVDAISAAVRRRIMA